MLGIILCIYEGIGAVDVMNEIEIVFSPESPQPKDSTIEINATYNGEDELLFKFFVGADGIWDTLKDFSKKKSVLWTPKEEGKYIIMVQAKGKDSSKPFDYISRVDYIVGKVEQKLISSVSIDKPELKVGERLKLDVESSKLPVVYKYWIKETDAWELIKDYSPDNSLIFTVKTSGAQEILVECRGLDSKNDFDDFSKVQFNVLPIDNLEITDFKSLSSELLVDSEITFQVHSTYESNRVILYKFIKINSEGVTSCLQDFSTKRIVSFTESYAGDYKILCLAKDMYSPKEYDDRALITYSIKLYNPIVITSFTSDLSSPQVNNTEIQLKAITKGGRNLLYRYIIDGVSSEDSGYIKESSYKWRAKKPGKYKISLWVKDTTFEGKYETQETIEFEIDEESNEPVKINEVLVERKKDYIRNEPINVKVIATGGVDLRYSFVVLRSGKEIEKVSYGTCNWVNFTPEQSGPYELEVRVKDKYSMKEYDCHELINFEVVDFLPAHIDYVLLPAKEVHLIGDNISFDVITRQTKETRIRYILQINGHKVEDTGFVDGKRYSFIPKCSGNYTIEVLAKSDLSDKEFDSKKIVKIIVQEAIPVTNVRIQSDKTNVRIDEAVTFSVRCNGGKDVCYEFYLMEHGEWNLVQNYSKKNYYSFIPFSRGRYKVLALCKSEYKNCSYEDYDVIEFSVK